MRTDGRTRRKRFLSFIERFDPTPAKKVTTQQTFCLTNVIRLLYSIWDRGFLIETQFPEVLR